MIPTPAPTISVVIPARDDAPALDACLRALAAQTQPPFEVVVVDNASTDDTAAVAVRHGARVVREDQVGIPAAASTGYDAARGDVIARLDADSLVPADWVAKVSRAMADPSVDAVTGVGHFYDMPRGLRRPAAALYLGSYFVLCHAALGHPALWGSAMAVRREVWAQVRDQVHRDDPEVHDDLALSFALGPRRRTVLDRSLAVGASGRCLRGWAQTRRRFRRAFRTLRLGWAVSPPWERWQVALSSGRREG